MPELPEVETTRRGLEPHLLGRRVERVILRRTDLRWPISPEVAHELPGQVISAVVRRAKYLLLHTPAGSALLHLGMSGSLRVVPEATRPRAHDHVDICLACDDGAAASGQCLRFNDPRRFGCLLWQPPGELHALLRGLGREPLEAAFDGEYLYQRSRGRSTAVKVFLMDQRVVTGVGNIYAAESLFMAGIHPLREAGRITRLRYQRLATAVKTILQRAIESGGTTLRDFTRPDGAPGYFVQELSVYGRAGQPCPSCGRPLRHLNIGGRATVFCPHCQPR